jgi:hypothetical protein
MPATLPTRTQRELQDAVTHVAYEHAALQSAVQAYNARGSRKHSRFELEAALIHARNLVDFFWAPVGTRQPHPNGIYAAHYLPAGADWITIRSGFPQRANQRYDAMSAQLAHLSTARLGTTTHDFDSDIDQIAAGLGAIWKQWRQLLNGTPWATAIDSAVTAWQAAL